MPKKQPAATKQTLADFTPEQIEKLLALAGEAKQGMPSPKQDRMAKARAVHAANVAQRKAAMATKATEPKVFPVPVVDSPSSSVPKPSLKTRIFGKKEVRVTLVPTLVVTRTTIGDGIRYIPENELPPDAFKMLYKGTWIYPLVETSDSGGNGKGEHTYIPWPLMDATDDAEGAMPPEELGMATYWPEAKAYYVQGSQGTNKLHIGLLVAIVIGLFLLIFLIFTVGLGN
jgi:hypothetical protein